MGGAFGRLAPRDRQSVLHHLAGADSHEERAHFHDGDTQFILTGANLFHVEAALDTIRLGGATDLKRAALRMPNIVSADLHDFDAVLPKDSPISVQGGEVKASLNLDMDMDYWARGAAAARILRSNVLAAGVTIGANTWLDAKLATNPKEKVTNVSDLLLRVRAGTCTWRTRR
jgi:hypothetical protein